MINNKSFEKEWLNGFRAKKEHKGIDVTILEKMVHAVRKVLTLFAISLNFLKSIILE